MLRYGLLCATALPLAFTGFLAPIAVQAQPATTDAVRQEMQRMKHEYDASLERMRREYESRLQTLETRIQGAETAAMNAEKKTRTQPAAEAKPGSGAAPSAFNPAIGVVLDGKYARYGSDPSTYRIPGFNLGEEAGLDSRGFAIGESEVTFSASVDQAFYGALTLAFTNDGEAEVEEAFVQTTALPWGFTAKAGRFFSGIGYLNEQHAHAWDFADAPLAYRAFLGNQLRDDGIQVRWLAPTPFFLEVGGETLRGDGFPAGGPGNDGVGQYSAFIHAGDDFGVSHSFRAGLSWLSSTADDRTIDVDVFSGRSNTAVADFVYKWAPNGNATERNLKIQGEFFLRREEGEFNAIGYSGRQHGWYLQSVYQFMPRWRVGLRYDQLHAGAVDPALAGTVLDNLGASPRRYSGMVDFSTSEFGRFRLQYNHDQSRPDTDHQFILQYTVSIGAHGAHAY